MQAYHITKLMWGIFAISCILDYWLNNGEMKYLPASHNLNPMNFQLCWNFNNIVRIQIPSMLQDLKARIWKYLWYNFKQK